MTTGMVTSSFACAWVRALNCLQNSMMLTPCWPSAGPIGGAGLALPAGTRSLMNPLTFFIYAPWKSGLFDLGKIELDRSGPAEDGKIDSQLLLLRLHFHHRAGEVGEGTLDHPHAIALLVGLAGLGPRRPLGHGGADAL